MTFRKEFQAVVLAAGKGSRMPELIGEKPKCLLPVGNKPIVWYPLKKLQEFGFEEVLLVVAENAKNEIQAALDKTDLELKIDYCSIPSNEDLGTADSLRLLHDKIHSDIIVLSCDLITNVSLTNVVNLFRKHNATLCSLLFPPQTVDNIQVPGPKGKHKPERDLVGIDAQTNRLIFLASSSDFETELTLPKSLVRKHPNIVIHSNLVDSHIYVMKNWILKYLQHETNFSTLKGELLPHIIKKQLSKPSKVIETNSSVVNNTNEGDIFHYAKESELDLLIRETSAYNDHTGDRKSCYNGDCIRCYAYVAKNDSFGIRVNTIPAYWAINHKIVDNWTKITNEEEMKRIDSKADIKSTQVDNSCIIWDGVKLNEKTSFKSSIIGTNTEVKSFSRVFNSVVMGNVVINERVALESCVVCDGAVIESGCNLKYCLIGSNHVVAEQSEHSNEVLTDLNRLMEF